jgi:hypothetical protein
MLACLCLLTVSLLPASGNDAPLAAKLPAGAIGYAEIVSFQPLADQFPIEDWRKVVENTEQYKKFRKSPQYDQFQAGKQIVAAVLGYDLETLVKRLLSTKVAVAVYPREGNPQPGVLVVVKYADRELWAKLRTQIEAWTSLAAAGKTKRESVAGRQITAIDDKAFYFTEADLFVASNDKKLIETASPVIAGKEGAKLADEPSFKTASANGAAGNVLRFFFDSEKARALLKRDRWAPDKVDNFVGTLLLQDLIELGATSKTVVGGINVEGKKVSLVVSVPGDPNRLGENYKGFLLDPKQAGATIAPKVKGYLAGIVIHRDIKELYQQREKLVLERVLPEFDKFESGINNLVPGKNFTEDLLPMLGKQLTFIAARQDFSDRPGKPAIKLPAFALVAELDKPKEGGDFLTMLFQAIVPIMNFQIKENGGQPQLLAMDKHNGVDLTFARPLMETKGERLPIVHNFQFCAATVGERYILTTSRGLCEKLIDAYKVPSLPKADGRNVVLDWNPAEVAESLYENIDLLVANGVKEGKPAAQAKEEATFFIEALKTISGAELATQVKPDDFQIRFEWTWK